MYHSCTDATVEDFLRRAGPKTRRLYAGFEAMIAACGPYHVSPAKTRITFMALVRFAGVYSIDAERMIAGFSMPHALRSRRFERVKEVVPGWWVHRIRFTRLDQLDDELQRWLRQSYRLMGMRERLDEAARRRSRKC
jgi:hypothetical protein